MTPVEAVETSVTNSLSQDYNNLDDLPIPNMYRFSQIQTITLFMSIISIIYNIVATTQAAQMSNQHHNSLIGTL